MFWGEGLFVFPADAAIMLCGGSDFASEDGVADRRIELKQRRRRCRVAILAVR
jgi:hypothetical protein